MKNSPVKADAGPLAGIRVLDLTSVVLGPLATQVLADYGADVIKIESPEGDLMRANGVSKNKGMSSIFLSLNRNKRSLALDLKTDEGVSIIRRLVPKVDVVVHNMRVAAIERLGLGYEALAAIKPDLVYCVATGFGEEGPDAGRPAFDDVIQAACGVADLIGKLGNAPDYAPTLLADKTAGMATVNAVLAALVHKMRTGQGQYVEVPMFETLVAFIMAEHMGGHTFRPSLGSAGYQRLLKGGRQPIATSDGYVAMLPYTSRHWVDFITAVGETQLLEQFDLVDRHKRNARIKEIYAHLRRLVSAMSTDECVALCDRLDIPVTRLYSIDNIQEHPHLKAVGLFEQLVHPSEGPITAIRPAARFSRTPATLRSPAPTLGEHNDEILREAGLAETEIHQLADKNVIAGKPAKVGAQ